MKSRHELLCVVCPCYNEEEVIGDFYDELKAVLNSIDDLDHTILFVDDGSTDASLQRLNALACNDTSVQVYSLSRNFGHQIALSAGLDVAVGDAVVMMDSDLQHPPSLIPQMIHLWREGYDVVSAARKSTADASFIKRLTSNGFYWLLNLLSDTPIAVGVADFCLLSHRAHAALQKMPERRRFLRGMISWIGFKRAFLPYDAPSRPRGKSKYTIARMLSLAFDAAFSFSVVPITIAVRLGLVIVACGVIYLSYVIFRYFVLGDLVQGWGSLISVSLILGGLQLAFIGLIGSYIARIFDEVKERPLYLFKQEPADQTDVSQRQKSAKASRWA
jgi:polyisoprenyl-phosphate glycosyltransferase